MRPKSARGAAAEGRAQIGDEQARARAVSGAVDGVEGADQPLVVGLVVAVRDERGEQAQGVDLGARRAAGLGVDGVELARSSNLRRRAVSMMAAG